MEKVQVELIPNLRACLNFYLLKIEFLPPNNIVAKGRIVGLMKTNIHLSISSSGTKIISYRSQKLQTKFLNIRLISDQVYTRVSGDIQTQRQKKHCEPGGSLRP